jgi:hypothetical protein
MKSTMIVACLATALPVCAFAALHAGDAAPDFSAPAALAGKTIAFSLAEARKARRRVFLPGGIHLRVQRPGA